MTTIAYRDGQMACDSCWASDDVVDALANKITRLSGGALYAGSGQADDRSLVAMLDKVKTPAQLPSYEALMALRLDAGALLVLPKGRIYKIGTSVAAPGTAEFECGLYEIPGPFAAIGSGWIIATVAMDCGKSARDAVRIACKYDLNSRPPVHVVNLALKAKP